MKAGLTRVEVLRTERLLHMEYTPSEIAEEIGCTVDKVYKAFVPAGCPHRRDERMRLWIVGTEFREWARAVTRRGRSKDRMKPGEAYCFRCRKPVKMIIEHVTGTGAYTELCKGRCPECDGKVNVARKKGASR